MTSLCTTTQVFDYLGITPNATQTTAMGVIVAGMESSIKAFCRWQVVEATKTSYLPIIPTAVGYHVPTAETGYGFGAITSGRNRLQLPSMYVKSITSIHEDYSARSGEGGEDFPTTTILVAGDDYFLEKDAGSSYSWSGGVIRVGCNWSSVPGTIKTIFLSGFSESELAGDQNALRFATIRECARAWIARQRENSLASTAGSDALVLSRERLGDYDVSYRSPFASTEEEYGSYGLSENFRCFLQDMGYVFMYVGA